MLLQRISKMAILLTLLTLTACVTTTESSFTKKASPERSVENYTNLGLGYLQQGRPDIARQRLRRALEINERSAPANDAMGLVWQAEGEPDLAVEYHQRALRSDRRYTPAHHHLGRAYGQLGQFNLAERHLLQASGDRYYDRRVDAYNELAMVYYRQEQETNAVDAYLEAIRLAPFNVEALVNVSTLLFEIQQYAESQRYFDRFDRLSERQQTQHNAHSLWLGIKLAAIAQDTQRSIRLGTQLKQAFSDTEEYRLYQQSLTGGL